MTLGVLPKGSDMKGFVTSRPAASALLIMIVGHMDRYSVSDLHQRMEDYADGGGDGDLTRATMRLACGLPVAFSTLVCPCDPVFVAETSGQSVENSTTSSISPMPGKCHIALLRHIVETGVDLCSTNATDRRAGLANLVSRGYWRELPTKGKTFSPLIPHFALPIACFQTFERFDKRVDSLQ